MVKKVTLHSHIDFVQPQAAFSFLFGDHRFIKKYHKEVNEDPNAEVSSWSADGRRSVRFSAPLNAPAVVNKLVGADSLKVTETQEYTRSGNYFKITSDPVIENPGGERFSSVGEIILQPGRDEDGTFVTINLVLEFKAGVWGVQGTMENFMEGQAKKSFKGWIKMAVAFCEEELAYATKPVHTIDDDDAEFYDPEDTQSTDMHPQDIVESSHLPPYCELNSRGGGKHLEVWFVNRVMRELNGIQITTTASKNHLEKLNSKIQKLEEDIQVIRIEVERRNSLLFSRRSTWGLVGLGVATGVVVGVGHFYLRRRLS
eukprot:TRINITY_DN21137_c0_g1_i1.p1 TRINITY_DN21137_c0_g1~~TRINITY_DN21137_c0_g1_i1.p1  ORF type:complete len:314 (+),score=55.72 TRINITY_DN21137_c0_g1_i1:198-1139(+)